MRAIIEYVIESSASLGILSLLYLLFFRKTQVLWFKRSYILTVIVFAAIIPFLYIKLPGPQPANMLPGIVTGGSAYLINTITIFGEKTNDLAVGSIEHFPWLITIYYVGLFIFMVRFLHSIFQLISFKRKAIIRKTNNYIMVDIGSNHSPFSFFRLLFINQSKYDKDELYTIINHELTHIQLKHSLDILLIELILIIQWFNPFVWYLRHNLKEVHEFQADRGTLKSGIDPGYYKNMLLCEAMDTGFSLVNHLNHSLIKKRLKMMNSTINKSIGAIKPALAILTLAILFIAFGCNQKDDKIYSTVDTMPVFPGGLDSLRAYIASHLNYPQDAVDQNISGKVFVSFVVSKNGTVTDINLEKGVDSRLDAEALRVVKSIPQWKPGENNGKAVDVKFTLPIIFQLPDTTYSIVEDMPQFPGGKNALRKYLMENVKYPESAKNKNQTGQTMVNFTVNASGKVVNVKVAKSSGTEALDEEALRVVESMPGWTPGIQHGEKVPVEFTVPIQFLLEKDNGAVVIHESNVNKEQMNAQVSYIKSDNGQITAKGKVTDKSGKPLKDVSVVLSGTTTGTVTATDGTFQLVIDNKNANELIFSYIGKKTLTTEIKR